jgi:hypothetical protein
MEVGDVNLRSIRSGTDDGAAPYGAAPSLVSFIYSILNPVDR